MSDEAIYEAAEALIQSVRNDVTGGDIVSRETVRLAWQLEMLVVRAKSRRKTDGNGQNLPHQA